MNYGSNPNAKYFEASPQEIKKGLIPQIGDFKKIESLQILDMSECDPDMKTKTLALNRSIWDGYKVEIHTEDDDHERAILTKKEGDTYTEFVIIDTYTFHFVRITGKFSHDEIKALLPQDDEELN